MSVRVCVSYDLAAQFADPKLMQGGSFLPSSASEVAWLESRRFLSGRDGSGHGFGKSSPVTGVVGTHNCGSCL